jgi:hypothetical protein
MIGISTIGISTIGISCDRHFMRSAFLMIGIFTIGSVLEGTSSLWPTLTATSTP